MPKRVPPDDPTAAYARNATAARRVGTDKRCACGEDRPEVLLSGSNPTICAACNRKNRGYTTVDRHHPAGVANNTATIPVPVNDHRAVLSIAQYNWPTKTLENPDGSPLRAAAACIRGFIDYVNYAIEKYLLWTPEMLEALDTFLEEQLGQKWWHNTPLDRFAPKRKRNTVS
jgi:hypothetical protein